MKGKVFGLGVLAIAIFSCVPQRKFEEVQGKFNTCEEELASVKRANQTLEADNTDLNEKVKDYSKQIKFLKQDTTVQGKSLRQMTTNYDKLNETYSELLDLQSKIERGNAKEMRQMRIKINDAQDDLLKKEDELKSLEKTLNDKSLSLNALQASLDSTLQVLELREQRVVELEDILHRKDSVVNALKDKVAAALFGFKDQGLSVQLKNGKVYVSLENQLLFKSGSYNVDAKGKSAIKELAEVLEKNPEINIVVEGHTDTDKYSGAGALKDNWDLSVIRATQIVKLLIEYGKLDPQRLTASGRSEYIPLVEGDTPEAKSKNRRIEIILTPKLDELFEILGSN